MIQPLYTPRTWQDRGDGRPLPPRYYRLNPALAQWSIAFVDGFFAWGWVRGNPEPQPLQLWLPASEGVSDAVRSLPRPGSSAEPAAPGDQRAIRGLDTQPAWLADFRALRGMRGVRVQPLLRRPAGTADDDTA
jgi:hypothetical protein